MHSINSQVIDGQSLTADIAICTVIDTVDHIVLCTWQSNACRKINIIKITSPPAIASSQA